MLGCCLSDSFEYNHILDSEWSKTGVNFLVCIFVKTIVVDEKKVIFFIVKKSDSFFEVELFSSRLET